MGKIADLMELMVSQGATRGQVIDAVRREETIQYLEEHSIPEPNTGCWLWLGSVDRKGYGRVNGRKTGVGLAHRLAFTVNVKDGAGDLLVCHKCDQPSCVNPDHLYAGTFHDNATDRVRRGNGAGRMSIKATQTPLKLSPADIVGEDVILTLQDHGYQIVPALRYAVDDEFNDVWAAYPHKVGKPAAFKAYKAARKKGHSHDEILAGLHRYVASKPQDRPWLNFSTFCNQERWKDIPGPVMEKRRSMGDSFIEAAMREKQQEEIGLFSMEYDDAQVGTVDATRGPVRRLPQR